MTKKDKEFLGWLQTDLIPDLVGAGYVKTAQDLRDAVDIARSAASGKRITNKQATFLDYLNDTLIPDLREIGLGPTADDLDSVIAIAMEHAIGADRKLRDKPASVPTPLPCPNCGPDGDKPVVEQNEGGYYDVLCMGCYDVDCVGDPLTFVSCSLQGSGRTKAEAIENWNEQVEWKLDEIADAKAKFDQVFIDFPGAVIVNGSDESSDPTHRKPWLFPDLFNIKILAPYHTGRSSGKLKTGIIVSEKEFQKLLRAYKKEFKKNLTDYVQVYTKEGRRRENG